MASSPPTQVYPLSQYLAEGLTGTAQSELERLFDLTQADATAAYCSRFHANRLAPDILETPGLIADAHQKHRLLGVLEEIDDALVLVFQIDGFSIGDQVQVGSGLHDIRQALAHFALQEAQHAADLLQRKSLAAEFRDHGDLDHFRGEAASAMTFVAPRYQLGFVPPLQLPQTAGPDA